LQLTSFNRPARPGLNNAEKEIAMLPRLTVVTVVASLLATSLVLADAPSAHAIRGLEPVPPIGDVFERDPDRDVLIACFARKSKADAKLARQLGRCGRLEKSRTEARFDLARCEKKAVRRHLVKTNKGGCPTPGTVPGGTVRKYSCDGLLCSCTGTADCNDMFINAGCSDVASCDTSGSDEVCQCLKSLD